MGSIILCRRKASVKSTEQKWGSRSNNIRNSLINNKEQSISIKSRIHAIDEDIAVINEALGRWKE